MRKTNRSGCGVRRRSSGDDEPDLFKKQLSEVVQKAFAATGSKASLDETASPPEVPAEDRVDLPPVEAPDPSAALVEAARTMGADNGDVLRTVLRPLLLPYVTAGLIFVFILSLNEYIIAYMVAGFEVETLPIKVLNSLRMGFQPSMCVGAVLFMATGVLGFSLVALIGDLPRLLGAPIRTARR